MKNLVYLNKPAHAVAAECFYPHLSEEKALLEYARLRERFKFDLAYVGEWFV